jgi:hypothetical protein
MISSNTGTPAVFFTLLARVTTTVDDIDSPISFSYVFSSFVLESFFAIGGGEGNSDLIGFT